MLLATNTIQHLNPPCIDPLMIGIVGGSHGGFLTAHMSARYPDVYKVAALRNPVINIPSMVTASGTLRAE